MPTYIDAIPKELRDELQLYKNYLFHSLANGLLKRFLFIVRNNNDISRINENKGLYIPNNINAQVVFERSPLAGETAFFQIDQEQLVTFKILNQIFNKYIKLSKEEYSGFYFAVQVEAARLEINGELYKHGYIKQLYAKNSQF